MANDTINRNRIKELEQPNVVENHMQRLFNEGIELYHYEREAERGRIHTNHANAIFTYIYKKLFKPKANPNDPTHPNQPNQANSILRNTDTDLLTRVLYEYLRICGQWDILPTINGFALLTGYKTQTFYNWSNGVNNGVDDLLSGKRLDVIKIIREHSQNAVIGALYADTVGRVTLANNERSIGLNYTAQNTILAGEVQRAISSQELPKIGLDEE